MAYFEASDSFKSLNQEGLLSLSLSLRTASPRCELFQQHANNILSIATDLGTPSEAHKSITWFALVANAATSGTKVITDIQELEKTLSSLEQGKVRAIETQKIESNATDSFSSLLFPFDHRRPGSPSAAYNLIVHADYSSPEFAQVHRMVMARGSSANDVSDLPVSSTTKINPAISLNSNVNYILRPFSAAAWRWHLERDSSESPVSGHMQGYGVELAAKNVEYRVLDVKSIKAGISTDETADAQNTLLQSNDILNVDGDPHAYIKEQIAKKHPELKTQLEDVYSKLFQRDESQTTLGSESSDAEKPAKVTDLDPIALDSLSLKAMQTIFESDSPIRALRDISQNLPTVAPLLSLTELTDVSTEYLERYSAQFEGGSPMLILNGRHIDIENLDPFDVLKIISEEIDKYKSLQEVGLEASKSILSALGRKVKSELKNDFSGITQGFSHAQIQEYLLADLDTGFSPKIDLMWKDVVTIVNDLETDAAYSRWPKRVRDLLKPTWPGQLTPVAKNFFTLVLVLDPASDTEGVRMLDQLARIILGNSIPIRLAYHVVVPNPKDKESIFKDACSSYDSDVLTEKCHVNWLWAKLLKSLVSSPPELITFLQIAARTSQDPASLRRAWDHCGTMVDWNDALNANDDFVARSYAFLSSAGLITGVEGANNNIVVLNGKLINVDPEEPLREIGAHLQQSKQQFQQDIYRGNVDDTTDLYAYALGDESEVFPGWNARIFEKNPTLRKLQFSDFDWSRMHYLTPRGSGDVIKPVTHLLIGDVAQAASRKAIKEFLVAAESSTAALSVSRLALLPIPGTQHSRLFKAFEYAIESYALSNGLDENTREFLDTLVDLPADYESDKFCSKDDSKVCAAFNQWVTQDGASDLQNSASQYSNLKAKFSAFLLSQANLAPTDISKDAFAIVTNGRVLVLTPTDASIWDETAWLMLTKYEEKMRASVFTALIKKQHSHFFEESVAESGHSAQTRPLVDLLWLRGIESDVELFEGQFTSNELLSITRKAQSDAIAILAASFAATSGAAKNPHTQYNQHALRAGITVRSDGSDKPAMISGVFFIDPLSHFAPSVSGMLLSFMETVPMELTLVLMPKAGLNELPLKNYYRYVFTPSPRFAPDGLQKMIQETAEFDHLPEDKILTMNVKTPGGWLISTKRAALDLDNILLKPVDLRRVSAEYSLDYLLVEGSCSDVSAGGQPPRGLKIRLGTASNPHVVDTIVMSNLGYFQLKANPGAWDLTLAPGRGSEIYEIQNLRSLHSASMTAYVDALSSDRLSLKVHKRNGMERASLEEEEVQEDKDGFWSNLFNSGAPAKPKEDDDTVHVFSVASGHLYERFLRIMMLSVRENTKSKVKFWIIKNFLSPAFVQTIDALGQELGFEVELVQYQWPEWLRGQTEKQRKIWGYKILFLDVLFPQSLKRVIFIDADQVVRTDLKQLMTIDLHGAPYGFTPFCDGTWLKDQNEKDPEATGVQEFKRGRAETRGFRFWDSGFWREHLRGRPYHISALFVVDLDLLRRKGYADQLRATYDQLSRDPGSLANLDQDLPNYLQHMVPIFSLPPEWLWCETWCSDDSKVFAKTIDLCNNPLTKTPKLEAALRIIPEWTRLDNATSTIFHKAQNVIIQAELHEVEVKAAAVEEELSHLQITTSTSDEASSQKDEL